MANETITGTLFVTDKIGVGINEPNEPNAQLHILSSTVAPSQAFLESGGVLLKLSVDGSGASIGTANAFPLSIQTDGSSRISINSTGDITTTGALTVQNNLLVNGNVGIGTSTAPTTKLEVNGTVKVNSLQIGALTVQSVSSGTPPTNSLQVNGAVKATSFQGNGATLDGIVKKVGDIMTGPLTVQNNLTVTGNVGIGTTEPQGKLDVRGAIHAGNSDIYFTKTDHNHTAFGNTIGLAAIENAANFGSLMILGRSTPPNSRRIVKLWDYLQVNGDLDVTGNIGIGISAPVAPLHIAGGYWNPNESEGDLRLGDATYKFKIGIARGGGGAGDVRLRAQGGTNRLMIGGGTSDALWIQNNEVSIPSGQFGIGTVNPQVKLHISSVEPHARIETTGDRAVVQFVKAGQLKWDFGVGTQAGNEDFWFGDFMAYRMIISRGTGNVHITGTLRQGCSKELKENIADLSSQEAVKTLTDLNPIKYSYKADIAKEQHLGFIAEDVPDLVASPDKKWLSAMDIVAVLTKVVQAQQTTISTLNEKVESLERQSQLWQANRD